MDLDADVRHILTKFKAQRHLFKSLLRPDILADRGAVRLLILLTWDDEPSSLHLLECMQEYFSDMENCDGEQFVVIANAFLDLACVGDRFDSAKLSFLLFKGSQGPIPWSLITVKINPILRWRLLYFLMLACQREEKAKEEMPKSRDWDRVLEWIRADIASLPSLPGEAWLDKQEIFRWASQFEDL